MNGKVIGVEHIWTGKQVLFSSWADLVEWMAKEIEGGERRDDLLPFCNGWNLDYWEADETAVEYKARLIDMAIGLQLI